MFQVFRETLYITDTHCADKDTDMTLGRYFRSGLTRLSGALSYCLGLTGDDLPDLFVHGGDVIEENRLSNDMAPLALVKAEIDD